MKHIKIIHNKAEKTYVVVDTLIGRLLLETENKQVAENFYNELTEGE